MCKFISVSLDILGLHISLVKKKKKVNNPLKVYVFIYKLAINYLNVLLYLCFMYITYKIYKFKRDKKKRNK